MHELLLSAATWWLGTALCGGLILFAACLLMRATGQPALRQRLGELAVLAALAVAVLRLGPAWLAVPWPTGTACAAPPAQAAALMLSFEVAALPAVLQAPDGVLYDVPLPYETKGRRDSGFRRDWSALLREPTPAPALLPEPPPAPCPAEPARTDDEWDWRPWAVGLTAVYLAASAALALRWLMGQWALGRLLRQGRPASLRLRRLFTLMAVGTVWPLPRLRLSRRLQVPVCFGLRRSAVLLPEVLDYTADETALRWVFAHELTHLRRRDPWSYWALGLAQAVYFYVPWFWWLRRQVRLCQEYIADAAAAREGAAADEYAAFLVSLAKRPATPLGATGLGSSSDLMRRVQMLLQSTTRVQASCPRRWSLVTAGSLFGLAVLLSGLGLRAEPPQKGDDQKEVIINKDDLKNVIILNKDDLKDGKIVIDGKDFDVLKFLPDDVLKLVPGEMNVVVQVLDGGQAKKQDGDTQPEKKTQRMTIVIDIDGRKVTIPIDGDLDADKIKAAVEKALAASKRATDVGAKAREQAQAAREKAQAERERAQAEREKTRAQAQQEKTRTQQKTKTLEKARIGRQEVTEEQKATREKALADMKTQIEAAQKALKGLEKDLGDERFKDLMKKLDDLKAGKGQAGEAAQRAAEVARRALEGQLQSRTVIGTTLGTARSTATRLGVRVERPNAVLADQLDLPRNQGLVIVEVTGDSAAAKAGIKANDILLELDGKSVSSDAAAFARQVQDIKSDGSVRAVVLRKGKKVQIRDVEMPEAKAPETGTVRPPRPAGGGFQLRVDPPPTPKPPVAPKAPTAPKPPVAPKAPATPKTPTTPKTETSDKTTSTSIEVNNGQFKAVQKGSDVTITVTGKVNDGKVELSSVVIQEGGRSQTFRSLDRVPEKHRDKVKKLISNAPDAPVHFEFIQSDDLAAPVVVPAIQSVPMIVTAPAIQGVPVIVTTPAAPVVPGVQVVPVTPAVPAAPVIIPPAKVGGGA